MLAAHSASYNTGFGHAYYGYTAISISKSCFSQSAFDEGHKEGLQLLNGNPSYNAGVLEAESGFPSRPANGVGSPANYYRYMKGYESVFKKLVQGSLFDV